QRHAVLVEQRLGRNARVDGSRRPEVATRGVDVSVPGLVHEAEEIVEVDAGGRAFIAGGGGFNDGRRECFLLGGLGHDVHSGRTTSLKSAPGSSGISRTTVRRARVQRSAQRLAALMPGPS